MGPGELQVAAFSGGSLRKQGPVPAQSDWLDGFQRTLAAEVASGRLTPGWPRPGRWPPARAGHPEAVWLSELCSLQGPGLS